MTDKFVDKLRLVASKKGYALYYPNVAPTGSDPRSEDNWLGIGYSEPQYNEKTGDEIRSDRFNLVLVDAMNPQIVEAIIKSLPKVKNA
jgi:hypothetical protein